MVVTHPNARRGRGVLFATAPLVGYVLSVTVAFLASLRNLYLLEQVKEFAVAGLAGAAVLAVIGFLLGRRVRDRLVATRTELTLERHGPLVAVRTRRLSYDELRGFAVEASLRSLGADTLLVAVHRDGKREPLLEGDPHSGQVAQLVGRLSRLREGTTGA